MDFLKEIKLFESEKAAQKEVRYSIDTVNQLYNEWKKVKRRINAANIVSTTVNKLSTISPAVMNRVHAATRLKAATLIMRCLDAPYFKPLSEKSLAYKKLYPLLMELSDEDVRIGGSRLKQAVLTSLSAAYSFQNKIEDGTIVFVAYDDKITPSYLKHLFGNEDQFVKQTYKMQILGMPQEFASLINLIRINHEKAIQKYKSSGDRTKHSS